MNDNLKSAPDWHAALALGQIEAYPAGVTRLSLVRNPSGHLLASFPEAISRLVLAHLLMSDGRDVEAARELAAVRRLAGNAAAKWLSNLCLISEVRLSREKRNSATRHAAAVDHSSGWKDVWSDPGTCLPKSVLAKLRRAAEHPASDALVQKKKARVSIFALGQFDLVVDGTPVRFVRKAPKKPLELLKALIAFGGRAVSDERLAESLWPDADGDAAYGALRTTLHRLRKLVGENTIERHDGRLCLAADEVWVDVWAFERGLAEMSNACRDTDADRLTDLTAHILTLYRGHFLADDPEHSWLLNTRECLRAKFLRQLESAAHILIPQHPEQAIVCYQKALEIEPLAESLYRGLMHAHLGRGHRAEALAVYDRCRQNLAAQLGISPCHDTEAIARQAQAT